MISSVGCHAGPLFTAFDEIAGKGIAYVPFFPLGGFSPLQSSALSAVASRLETTPMAVALAWLLRRSPNILLIPGTSSVAHLTENVAGAATRLDGDDLAEWTTSAEREVVRREGGSSRECWPENRVDRSHSSATRALLAPVPDRPGVADAPTAVPPAPRPVGRV
jgi:hypothetical protein